MSLEWELLLGLNKEGEVVKRKQKAKSIASKVSLHILGILTLMSICLSLGIQNAFYRELSLAEEQYMIEVISRISTEVNMELNHYIDAAASVAKSQSIKEYLENVEQGILAVPEETWEQEGLTEEYLDEYVEEYFEEEYLPEEELEEEVAQEEASPTPDLPVPEVSEEIWEEEVYQEQEQESSSLSYEETETWEAETLGEVTREGEELVEAYTATLLHDGYEFSQISGYDTALTELQEVANLLGDSVLYVVLCSIAQDDFFNSEALEGGDGYTLSTRPFYTAYTTQSRYITDPYLEVLTGKQIITIAEPIFNSEGRVTGLLLVQLALDKLNYIVTSATFGETGASMLIDRNNDIIAYSNSQVVGMNIRDLDYSGSVADQELANPSGIIDEYSFAGAKRTGGIVTVSELSGWKLLLAMDSTEFKSNISKVTLRLNIALILAILLCSGLCARSVYKHLAPMKQLEQFMKELAEGNLSGNVDYNEPNEIGSLAIHMNHTATSLNNYILMIDKALSNLSAGDLTRPEGIAFQGDFKILEESISGFAQRLSDSFVELKVAMTQMTLGSEQVADGAQLLASGSFEQTQSIEQLNNLISTINETIVLTAQNSSSVTGDARNISENLVKSNVKMQELAVSVQDIRAMSDEVKRIIKTIEEVAFQTNILSLNASVEAARAGSAGRGFAVVADQVRLLSAQTAEAAEETTKIINDIATAIESGTDLAESTSHDLQSVVDEVDIFVENISNISLSAQDQADAIGEIHRGVDEITQVVVQNSAISEESAASSEELSAQSNQMLEMVQHYKLIEKEK